MHKDILLVGNDAEYTGVLMTALKNRNLEVRVAHLRDEAEPEHFLHISRYMPCGVRREQQLNAKIEPCVQRNVSNR